MPDDTPENRNRIPVGEVYFQWDSRARHRLVLDLTGPLPAWVIEAGGESVPLEEYLALHPGRREEVRQVMRRRLAPPDTESSP